MSFKKDSFDGKWKSYTHELKQKKIEKNRIYQKELGIFHGIQRGKKQSEEIKTRKQKPVKIKNTSSVPPSFYDIMPHPVFVYMPPLFFSFYKLVFSVFGVHSIRWPSYTSKVHKPLNFDEQNLTSLNPNSKAWIGRIWFTFRRHVYILGFRSHMC